MSDDKTIYWVCYYEDSAAIMSGTAVRSENGWSATPEPGTARFVYKVYDSIPEARKEALRYCTAKVKHWQQQAKQFKEKN